MPHLPCQFDYVHIDGVSSAQFVSSITIIWKINFDIVFTAWTQVGGTTRLRSGSLSSSFLSLLDFGLQVVSLVLVCLGYCNLQNYKEQ